MTERQLTGIVTIVFWILASTLLGIGTNIFIGLSLFFAIWTIAGLLQLYE